MNRFYNCVHGTPYELPCATSLVFDEAQGTCVREEQASEFSKKCEEPLEKRESALFFANIEIYVELFLYFNFFVLKVLNLIKSIEMIRNLN
jgi:hypothetical protein